MRRKADGESVLEEESAARILCGIDVQDSPLCSAEKNRLGRMIWVHQYAALRIRFRPNSEERGKPHSDTLRWYGVNQKAGTGRGTGQVFQRG